MPDESEFLCGDWVWDASMREMRHYPRRKKGHADEPDAVERLQSARRVTIYRWSQQPMQTATGEMMSARQARVQVEYQDGRKLDINEFDRECAQTLATTIAAAYGLPVEEQGAPTGRMAGNIPKPDDMGRYRSVNGRTEITLDPMAGEIAIKRNKRLIGSERRTLRTNEVRRLELERTTDPRGSETFAVVGVVGADEERLPLVSYTGLEGWSEPDEWREFTQELAQRLGVEARVG